MSPVTTPNENADHDLKAGEIAEPEPASPRLLALMRHAKSDWGDESLSDHDRPLNRRGRRDAPNIGRWMSDQDLVPDVMLVSSAQRTRETATLMMKQWNHDPVVTFLDDLYHSTPEEIIRSIGFDGCDAKRLLVVAHNPGMTGLVSHFAGEFTEMPTAAIAVFAASCPSWDQLRLRTPMKLLHHMRPKALYS